VGWGGPKVFDTLEPLAYSLLEEDLSTEFTNLFNEDDREDTPVPESVHEDPTSSVISDLCFLMVTTL
jgi:hypothetical protein